MACNCSATVISTPNNKCEGCLKIASLRYSCTDGPAPCGGVEGTLVVNLATHNDVSACDCGSSVQYSIVEYDADFFSSVSITAAGILTAITSNNFTAWKEGLIKYKVNCPCNILSGTGNIYVCKKDLCAGVVCGTGDVCDQCDGTCVPAQSDIDISGGSVTGTTAQGTSFGN